MTQESEPPIREFADRGTIWLLETPQNLHDLLTLVSEEITQQLDFSGAIRDNRSFVPDDLNKQEADLIFRVPFREGTGEVWIYVLLEHQSKPDRTMGLRLLSYMVQLWETERRHWDAAHVPPRHQHLTPILPVVFYTGKRRWRTPLSLEPLLGAPPLLSRFVPRFETLFLQLREMPAERLRGSALAQVLRVLQAADAPFAALEAILRKVVVELESLPASAQAEWRKAMHYLLLLIRHKRAPLERTHLYEMVTQSIDRQRAEEIRTMAMTDAETLLAEGEARGRAEGETRGRIEGAKTAVLRLGVKRFGPADERVQSAIEALTSIEQLEQLFDRTLEVESWEALLDAHA